MKRCVLVQLPGANAGKPDVAGAAKQAVKKSPLGFMQVGDLADGNLIEQVMYPLHSIYSVTEVYTLDSTAQMSFIGGLVSLPAFVDNLVDQVIRCSYRLLTR